MPFDADDIAMFNDADMPGYVEATVGGTPVAGRFRANFAEALGIVSDSRPMFSGATSDLTGVTVGSAVEIDGTAYTVAEVRVADGMPDMTRLMLKT